MQKHPIKSLILSLGVTVSAETQKTFDFVFTDASGLSDTITLGIDSAATDSLDVELGEINIRDTVPHPFDVRFVGMRYQNSRRTYIQDWASKKQYVNPDCGRDDIWSTEWYPIGIYSKNWPVTVSWDSSQFTGICPSGGGIAGYISDGISRTSLQPTRFDTTAGVTFTSHNLEPSLSFSALSDRPGGVDTAEVFYLTLATKMKVGLSIQPHHQLQRSKKSDRWFSPWSFGEHDFLGRRLKILAD